MTLLESKILQKHISLTCFLISLILGDTLSVIPPEEIQSAITDIPETVNKYTLDSLNIDLDGEIFESRMEEAKSLLAEAIISDMTGDTLYATFQFELLFEALAGIEVQGSLDEFDYLDFNRLLTASINYYENDAETVNKIESGLSVALLRDRLNKYIYSQTLEDLVYVEESVEIIPGHIPITYNSKVASIIKFFQNDGKSSVQKWLNRMDKYKAVMLPILEEEGVPPELFYVSMIESGLNPRALSYAYASGYWQFISSTAKLYGLKKTWWIDERRDFEKSTRAAARYFKDLHDYFDDWYLALAAYNCGQARVNRTIKKQGTRDYWKLSRLPSETRNYVPNVMAAIFISNDPEKYGFIVQSDPVMEWMEKIIDKPVLLDELAKISGVNTEVLKQYNPELKQNGLPPLNEKEKYILRIPTPVPLGFDSLFALIPIDHDEEIVLLDHKVKRGENLWLIARKYKVTIQDIVSLNKLHNARYIRPGQKLKIPTDGYEEYKKLTMSKSQSKKIFHTVRYGDTLSGIAQKYYTSVRKIKKWNGLRGDFIRSGQKLIIWVRA